MTVRVSARDGVGMGVEINPDAGRSLAGPLHKVDPASAFSWFRKRASLT